MSHYEATISDAEVKIDSLEKAFNTAQKDFLAGTMVLSENNQKQEKEIKRLSAQLLEETEKYQEEINYFSHLIQQRKSVQLSEADM